MKSRSQTPVRGGWAAAARGSLNKKAAVKQGSEEVVEIKPFNRQEVRDFLADKYQYYLGKVDKARKEDISIYKSLEGGWGKTSKKGKESNSSVEILNEIARQIE